MEKLSKTFFETIKEASALGVDETVHPLDLKEKLLAKYQTDWLEWLPEVLDSEVLGDSSNPVFSDKMQALRIAMTTDAPWVEWHIFANVGKAFNNQVPNFGILQPLSLEEAIVTKKALEELRPNEKFSDEVLRYIATVAFQEQYVYVPFLPELGPYLDNMIFDYELRNKTKAAWFKVKDDKNILRVEYKDTDPLHTQLANLAIVQQYLKEYHDNRKI